MSGPPGPVRRFITTPLESHHDRAAFSCGEASLDNYLRDRAVPDAKGLSTITYVLIDAEDGKTIQGYYSLSATSIEFGAVPRDIARKLRISRHRTMSATLIGRLAVSAMYQGKRLGEALLFDALERAWFAAQEVGSALIIVHAINDDAERFYKRYGFIPFPNLERELFIPTATVGSLVHENG